MDDGCLEHIVTLRLLIESAMCKKRKLYIMFVDFSKAYDRVPRDRLIKKLKQLGCGAIMLTAIAACYNSTKMALGLALVTASLGVRQGSPSSGFLFTCYVNPLIRAFKENCIPDPILGILHCLMLMDDTVIFASSRDQFQYKFNLLLNFCDESGMILNADKTKFMVINGADIDKRPITCRDITVKSV